MSRRPLWPWERPEAHARNAVQSALVARREVFDRLAEDDGHICPPCPRVHMDGWISPPWDNGSGTTITIPGDVVIWNGGLLQ